VAVEELFESAATSLLAGDAGIERGRMFGSIALKTGGKVFAICTRGAVVVKVAAPRVAELVRSGAGRPFDPGHGRVMREWVSLVPADGASCDAYLREALAFVSRGGKAGG
jgi:TfoX/Sxy family transcriptional regulator of competence genes